MAATTPGSTGVLGRGPAAEEARRQAILDAATQLFQARGFEGTTTDDIAAAAGVTKKTLYRYVGSKEHLLYEIHDRFLEEVLHAVKRHSGTPGERFREMVRAHMRVLAARQKEIEIFFGEIKHLNPQKREQLSARRRTYEEVLRSILHDGIAAGVFVERDVSLVSRGMLGGLNEIYRWFRSDGRYTPDQLADVISDFLLKGIAARPVEAVTYDVLEQLPDLGAAPHHPAPIDRIIAAAAHLFSEMGYHRTTTRELAERAEMTKGALYYHVGHKEEILVWIHEMVAERGLSALTAVARADGPAPRVVAGMFVAHCRVMDEQRDGFAVVSEEMKYLPPAALRRVAARRDRYEKVMGEALARGVAAGELRDVDVRVLVLLVVGMLNSTYRWYQPNGRLSPDAMGLALADLVLRGLCAADPGA
jgi:AcrR family transcriptional regulator